MNCLLLFLPPPLQNSQRAYVAKRKESEWLIQNRGRGHGLQTIILMLFLIPLPPSLSPILFLSLPLLTDATRSGPSIFHLMNVIHHHQVQQSKSIYTECATQNPNNAAPRQPTHSYDGNSMQRRYCNAFPSVRLPTMSSPSSPLPKSFLLYQSGFLVALNRPLLPNSPSLYS